MPGVAPEGKTIAELTPTPPSRKQRHADLLRSVLARRFLLRAGGRLTRIGGRAVLRLTHEPAIERPVC